MDSSSPPQKKKKKLDSSHPAEAGRRSTTPTDIKTLVCVAHYIPQWLGGILRFNPIIQKLLIFRVRK